MVGPLPLQRCWGAVCSGAMLWLAGFKDALRIHRCIVFFVHDPRILAKTANCFMLNGIIFLGSIVLLEYALTPSVNLLVTAVVGAASAPAIAGALLSLYHVLWLFPAYVTSLLVNCIWYNEIAELVVAAAQRRALQQRAEQQGVPLMPGDAGVLKVHRPDAVAFISQEVYRAALFAVFFAQVLLAGAVPLVGPLLNFVLLSWLYALYCFDYKWSLHGVALQQRIAYFERHWCFFLGFGSATVLPCTFVSYYTGAALLGLLFPLYIMMAADSNPKLVYKRVLVEGAAGGSQAMLPPLPVFKSACWATNQLLGSLAVVPRLVRFAERLGVRRRHTAMPAHSDSSSLETRY